MVRNIWEFHSTATIHHREEEKRFLALAEYDKSVNGGNEDGQIDQRDSIFTLLLLWRDTNHNGISEQSELHSLVNLGVAILDFDYKVSRRLDQIWESVQVESQGKDIHGPRSDAGHGM